MARVRSLGLLARHILGLPALVGSVWVAGLALPPVSPASAQQRFDADGFVTTDPEVETGPMVFEPLTDPAVATPDRGTEIGENVLDSQRLDRVRTFFQQDPPLGQGTRDSFNARERSQPISSPVLAPAGLRVDVTAYAAAVYDSNPLLLSPEQQTEDPEARGGDFSAQVNLTQRMRNSVLQANGRLAYDEFNASNPNSGSDLESFDQFAGLQYDYTGRKTLVTLYGDVVNTTTRRALILDDIQAGLTDDRVLTYGGGGSVSRQISRSGTVRVFGSVERREVEAAGLVNYTSIQTGTGYVFSTSPRDDVGVTVGYNRFMPDEETIAEADTYNISASWTRQVNPKLSFSIDAGPQLIVRKETSATPEDSRVTAFATAGMTWIASKRDAFQVELSSTADPSVVGQLQTNNQVSVRYRADLNPNFVVQVPISAGLQSDALQDNNNRQVLIDIAPEVRWSPIPSIDVAAQYRRRRRSQENFSVATSDAVRVSLNYRWQSGQ